MESVLPKLTHSSICPTKSKHPIPLHKPYKNLTHALAPFIHPKVLSHTPHHQKPYPHTHTHKKHSRKVLGVPFHHSSEYIDCLAVSVFFSLFSLPWLQASVTVKNRGGAISNDRMVAPSHFGCKQRLLKLNHIWIP